MAGSPKERCGVGFKNTWGVGLVERGLLQLVGGKRQALKTGMGDWSPIRGGDPCHTLHVLTNMFIISRQSIT